MSYEPSKLNDFLPDTAPTFSPDLRGLIAWLETQEPSTKYNWKHCSGGCLIGKFYAAIGHADCGYDEVFPTLRMYHATCSPQPWTFGAALQRARQYLGGE